MAARGRDHEDIDRLRIPAEALRPRADGAHDLLLTADLRADLERRFAPGTGDLARIAGDLDAWNLRRRGDWHVFTARLDASLGPRDYRRPLDHGDIIADAPGPLWAHLAIGGPRRAGFVDGPPRFAHHVLAPGDHIHSVGLEGTDEVTPTAALQRIPHRSLEALIADQILTRRAASGRALPLIFVRAETDAAPAPGSIGFRNFCAALDSLCAAARALGTMPRIASIGIETAAAGDPAAIAAAARRLMAAIEDELAHRRLPRAPFLLFAASGDHTGAADPASLAHWALSWLHRPHRLIIPGPDYAFAMTEFARPTPEALLRKAELSAHALGLPGWHCPLPLLAELRKKRLRVTFQSLGPLVLDDALAAGPSGGFAIQGAARRASIEDVAIAEDDPRALILTLDRQIDTRGAHLAYAYAPAESSPDALPAARGGVRDDWQAPSSQGGALHRWALPALLPIHQAEG